MMTRRHAACAFAVLVGACTTAPPGQVRVVRSFLEARQDKVVMQKWDLSCGAAALATILTYEQGDHVTERDIAATLLKHTSIERVQQQLGFSLLDLKRYAEGRGFIAQGYGNLTMDDLEKLGPTIVPVRLRDFNHFVVFRGVWGDRVLLADPAFGNRTMPVEKFKDIWQRNLGFTVARADGAPTPNRLQASPGDFWAYSPSEQDRNGERQTITAVASVQTEDRGALKTQTAPADTQAAPVAAPRRDADTATKLATLDAPARRMPAAPPKASAVAPADPPRMAADEARRSDDKPSTPKPVASDKLAHAVAQVLVAAGNAMLERGDILGSRLMFERAAAAGDRRAATEAGKTFDPLFLTQIRVSGPPASTTSAATWYLKAMALGDTEAGERLRRLVASPPP
jgi:predicted double-glycine peptidase